MHHRTVARCWLEIDLEAIAENVRRIRRHVGERTQVMAVLKADAYGHGAISVAEAVLAGGARRLGVANVDEAIELRTAGLQCPIHVLGPLLLADAAAVVEHDLIPSVSDAEQLGWLNLAATARSKIVTIHQKVDTGMGRFGVLPDSAVALAKQIQEYRAVRAAGICTHMGNARDVTFTHAQLDCFQQVCSAIGAAGVHVGMRHVANTRAAIDIAAARLDTIRTGLGIYGIHDNRRARDFFPLVPALAWKTVIAQIRSIPSGHGVGYDKSFTASRPMRVALLPVGYADGYRRGWSNCAHVLINNRRALVIGMVSMDWTAVDVTDIGDAETGHEVTLVGKDQTDAIWLEDLAELIPRTIPYEILTSFGKRNTRRWLARRSMLAAA